MNTPMSLVSALFLAFLPVLPAATQSSPSGWALAQGTLTYHVSDALHAVSGVSTAARGKGLCGSGECNFLVAAPVQSFQSGDTNRDLHMIQAVHGAQNSMVVVRTELPESKIHPGSLRADIQVQFGGQTHIYRAVPFTVTAEGKDLRLTGTLPLRLSDFSIKPPQFLFITVKNSVPVDVDLLWQPAL